MFRLTKICECTAIYFGSGDKRPHSPTTSVITMKRESVHGLFLNIFKIKDFWDKLRRQHSSYLKKEILFV